MAEMALGINSLPAKKLTSKPSKYRKKLVKRKIIRLQQYDTYLKDQDVRGSYEDLPKQKLLFATESQRTKQ